MNRLLIGATDKTRPLLALCQEHLHDGFLLIDPDGDLAEIVADRIPKDLTERVAYLDAADLGHPFGLNVLDRVRKDARHKAAKDFCAFFDILYPEGPTTLTHAKSNYLLLNSLCLLMDAPRPNVLSLTRLLDDHRLRDRCLKHCGDPIVRDFWTKEFPTWKPEDVLPLKAKVGDLLTSPVVRNILCQPHNTFSLEPGRIVIANLDRGKIGDQTAFLLGSLLLSRSKGMVIINSFGFFAADYLAWLLVQGRFMVALNYLDELPRKVRQAVLTFDDIRAVRANAEDAEALAFPMGVIKPSNLTDNAPLTPPEVPPSLHRIAAIRKRSRACHTRLRKEVELEIADWLRNRGPYSRQSLKSPRSE